MTALQPRLRMFAGPNGSGKSTLKEKLRPEWLGVYLNADDMERDIVSHANSIALTNFRIATNDDEIREFFRRSTLLKKVGLQGDADQLCMVDGVLRFGDIRVTSYHAAVLADFVRRKLLAAGVSFSFETVMSSRDKVEFLCEAQARGYRTYLYFVATDDPSINVGRVRYRVKAGGHPVPEDKIVERYSRTLGMLKDAIRCSSRAFIFDNTGAELVLLAEVTDGSEMRIDVEEVNQWFDRAVLG